MERDGVLAHADDPYLLTTRKPKAKEMVPTVVYKDKPLLPGRWLSASLLCVVDHCTRRHSLPAR